MERNNKQGEQKMDRITRFKKQVHCMTDCELADEIEYETRAMSTTPNERFVNELKQNLAVLHTEKIYRTNGGKRGNEIRQPYLSDGERAALNLPDRGDNF